MKKCCESTLQNVIKLIGEEVRSAMDGARSGLPLATGSSAVIGALYRVQMKIRSQLLGQKVS